MRGGLKDRLAAVVERLTRPERQPTARAPLPTVPASAADANLRLSALEASANAMFIADRDGVIQWVNSAFTRLSGYPSDEIVGRTPRLLRSGRQGAGFYAELWKTILAGQVWHGRLVNKKKNGEVYDIEQTISPILGADGEVSHYFSVHEDIHDRLAAERRLKDEALLDRDTGLANWNLLRRRLTSAVARAKRSGHYLAVMTLGFRDAVPADAYARAAPLVVNAVRQADLVGRHGDTLIVVMEDLEQPELAADTARRVLKPFRGPLPGEPELKLRAQAGIAIYPGDDESPELLVQHAEMARRGATGRGEFRFFDYSV